LYVGGRREEGEGRKEEGGGRREGVALGFLFWVVGPRAQLWITILYVGGRRKEGGRRRDEGGGRKDAGWSTGSPTTSSVWGGGSFFGLLALVLSYRSQFLGGREKRGEEGGGRGRRLG
jgi:hypothetical protein